MEYKMEAAAILKDKYNLSYSLQDIDDWMAGGEPTARPTAQELAEQIAEWEGVNPSMADVIEMIKKSFGRTMEDASFIYHSKAYDSPVYFSTGKDCLTVQAGGLEFDVPYEEFVRIDECPDRCYILMHYRNKVRTYVVWR